MAGRRGLIFGVANDHSIAWGIARTLRAHGAELAFTYQDEAILKRVRPLAESVGSDFVMPCDVADAASMDAVFEAVADRWPSIDFAVHAIAYSDKRELRGRFVSQFDVKQSIGKRYARMDEAGTPFCVTVDGDTAEDQAATVRDRDTGSQVRIALDQVASYLREQYAEA